MTEVYVAISVMLLVVAIFCGFIYKSLFAKDKWLVAIQYSEDQKQEFQYILQSIKNASKYELESLAKRAECFLPAECKPMILKTAVKAEF